MSVVPHYNLDDVREAAKCENIAYSRSVFRDLSNLGLEFSDVIECILSLTRRDFHKGYEYSDGKVYDAYRINYCSPSSVSGKSDPIYIKFRILNGCLRIDVASFHLDR